MKNRLAFLPLVLALVASLAACGGGSASVPTNAVALVGSVPVSNGDFKTYFNQAIAISKTNGVTPTPGSQQWDGIKNQVVAYLIQVNELEQQAKKEKVSVTPDEVTTYITKLAKTSYGGDMAKLTAELKKQGLTMATARQEVQVNLLAQKIHDKVTKSVQVSDKQARGYYDLNIQTYHTGAETTRSVEYILFKCAVQPSTTCPAGVAKTKKTLAGKVEQKLQNGASFVAMAKKYSEDPSTASLGGKYTLIKGGVVPAFEKAGFKLQTGQTSGVVDATSTANSGYGYFIIKALAPAKHVKAHTTPFSEVKDQIKQTLSKQAVDQLWSDWLSQLKAQYNGKVSYQTGYEPPTTTAITDTNVTTG